MKVRYIVSSDGHKPSVDEVEAGKRKFRRLRAMSHPVNPIRAARRVRMTLTDVNNRRGWSFQNDEIPCESY